ncbi:MAG: hypothetical protein LQ346_006342 [Caloplaca aetnensis]|nr:MAG: hypothetical protein LQ346_006342 [Caloplaca aetnensis]
MFKGRSRGGGRTRRGLNATQKVPLKGLFSDGTWHCNCAPRLPAQHFQTKNGGKNHGRWFYTCQQSQPKRCDFFLWDDDAKPREAAAVWSNSRTEPLPAPQTPRRPVNISTSYGLQTPLTDASQRHRSPEPFAPCTPSRASGAPTKTNDTQDTSATLTASDEEFYDWPASDEDDVLKAADQASSKCSMPPPETPSKVARTDVLTTPGKRRFAELETGSMNTSAWPTPSDTDGDVFKTPLTTLKRNGHLAPGQTSPWPSNTPTPRRFTDMLQAGQDSELTSDVLRVLQDSKILIDSNVKAELKTLCDRHALSTRGILKGRDISRATVNTKNAQISELQENIAALQAERETNRAYHLTLGDMASEAAPSETAPSEPQARTVIYCGVCTLPPEYCEFGGTAKKCKEWLEKTHPDMHEKLYSEEAVAATLSTLSLDAQKRAAKDSQKKEAKAAAAEAKAAETKAQAQVLIKRVERNKRKYVTAVSGLEAHGMDLKKVAKEWGKKFATGSSVTKTASGGEEVVVQGDNSDEIFDWVVDVAGVPEANVECIEDKKKKGA